MVRELLKFLYYELLRCVALPLFVIFFHLRIFGARHVPEKDPVIIASNHQSYLDPLILGLGTNRHIHFMARRSLFEFPLFRWLIVGLNAYPVEREGTDIRGMRETIRRLRDGNAVVIFPEGTRTRDGTVGKLRRGISIIAEKTNAVIVPAAISGSFEAWPRTKSLFRLFVPITLRFGRPLRPANNADFHALPEELHRAINTLITEGCTGSSTREK